MLRSDPAPRWLPAPGTPGAGGRTAAAARGATATHAVAVVRSLRHPDVRALAALVATPSLIDARAAGVAVLEDGWRWRCLVERCDWLAALDADPRPLTDFLVRANARQLGRYAEALWQFWFAQLPGAEVHAAGLPVKDGAAVRGEFDFIVSLPGLPGVSHLETGYKFFLYCPPGADASRCVGPDPSDRLDRKWRHMQDVQLPLSQSPLGRRALPAALRETPITPRACLQGYLFHPLDGALPPLSWLAPNHARGWWQRSGTPGRWSELAPAWVELDKRAWIAPAFVGSGTADAAGPLDPRALQARLDAHFVASRQARLVAGLAADGDEGWHEVTRVFVVAADWRGADPTPPA